jgi:hypothetical protein
MKRPHPAPPMRLHPPHGCNEPERADWQMVAALAMTATIIVAAFGVYVWWLWKVLNT